MRNGLKSKASLRWTPSQQGNGKSVNQSFSFCHRCQGHLFDLLLFYKTWCISNIGTDGKLIVKSLQIQGARRQAARCLSMEKPGSLPRRVSFIELNWDPTGRQNWRGLCCPRQGSSHLLLSASSTLTRIAVSPGPALCFCSTWETIIFLSQGKGSPLRRAARSQQTKQSHYYFLFAQAFWISTSVTTHNSTLPNYLVASFWVWNASLPPSIRLFLPPSLHPALHLSLPPSHHPSIEYLLIIC